MRLRRQDRQRTRVLYTKRSTVPFSPTEEPVPTQHTNCPPSLFIPRTFRSLHKRPPILLERGGREITKFRRALYSTHTIHTITESVFRCPLSLKPFVGQRTANIGAVEIDKSNVHTLSVELLLRNTPFHQGVPARRRALLHRTGYVARLILI